MTLSWNNQFPGAVTCLNVLLQVARQSLLTFAASDVWTSLFRRSMAPGAWLDKDYPAKRSNSGDLCRLEEKARSSWWAGECLGLWGFLWGFLWSQHELGDGSLMVLLRRTSSLYRKKQLWTLRIRLGCWRIRGSWNQMESH